MDGGTRIRGPEVGHSNQGAELWRRSLKVDEGEQLTRRGSEFNAILCPVLGRSLVSLQVLFTPPTSSP